MPSLLVVDDDRAIIHAFRRGFQNTEVTVFSTQTATDAMDLVARYRPDVVVLDTELPDQSGLAVFEQIHQREPSTPVIFVTASATANAAIEAIERGAFDYVVKPMQIQKIRELVAQALKSRQLVAMPGDGAAGGEPVAVAVGADRLVGRCPAMQEVYKAIGRVASKKINVLICGESGTGKELVAMAIQQHSSRASSPFLAVNCAAIPEPLLESELFGHEKGAFTGADAKRIGKFEQCSGGTLFLDEVGDMTPLMQSKVLRVLQEGRFERVGGNNTIETDVRIIAATNRNLEQMVAEGHFRADLYYRLNVFCVELPPLRDRMSDIPLLVDYFLGTFCRELGKLACKVSPEAMELLMRYSWPGNIRELQSVLKRAVLQSSGPVLAPEFFPMELTKGSRSVGLDAFIEERLRSGSTALHAEAVAFTERIVLAHVLRHTDGNQSQAAKILCITRGTLRNKLRELGITIRQAVNVESTPLEPRTGSLVRPRARAPANLH